MAELGPYNTSPEMDVSFGRANSERYDMKGGRLCCVWVNEQLDYFQSELAVAT